MTFFFVGEIRPCQMNESCGIVGGGSSPDGIGAVEWSWKYDGVNVYKDLFPNTLYYPGSPVSIMAVTLYARSMNDLDCTFIKSQAYQSTLTWNFGKHTHVVQHPCNYLPEMLVNDRFITYTSFMSFFAKLFPMSMPEHLP